MYLPIRSIQQFIWDAIEIIHRVDVNLLWSG
jgi:hypothetical protein